MYLICTKYGIVPEVRGPTSTGGLTTTATLKWDTVLGAGGMLDLRGTQRTIRNAPSGME